MKKENSHTPHAWTVIVLAYTETYNRTERKEPGPDGLQQTYEFFNILQYAPIEESSSVFLVAQHNAQTTTSRIHAKDFLPISIYTDPHALQSPVSLTRILKDLKSYIPENNRLLLLTWGHGSVFGIFKTSQPTLALLTGENLAKSILDGLGRKADLLIAMNCWMQNLPFTYALRPAANYIVAPQGMLTHFTYDYEWLLSHLEGQEPEAIGRGLIKTLKAEHSFQTLPYTLSNDLPACTFFFCRLDEAYDEAVKALLQLIADIAGLLETSPSKIQALITDSRNTIFTWDNAVPNDLRYYVVDFISFMEEIDKRKDILREKIKRANELIEHTYVDKFIGSSPYMTFGMTSTTRYYRTVPTGTGIWFPATKQEAASSFFATALQKNGGISFYQPQQNKWIQLLDKYYDLSH